MRERSVVAAHLAPLKGIEIVAACGVQALNSWRSWLGEAETEGFTLRPLPPSLRSGTSPFRGGKIFPAGEGY